MIRGTSNDVIHSFWVPNLHGKRDLIPSRVTDEWIQADQSGPLSAASAPSFAGCSTRTWRCGWSPNRRTQFEAWMQRQLQPAIEPTDARHAARASRCS